MQIIETDEWTTAADAARLLGVSHQRVHNMINEGSLDVLRPWQNVTLIGRRSIAAWLAGDRLSNVRPSEARRWLLRRTGADDVQRLDINDVRDAMLEFITEARPRWDKQRQDLWALETASKLFRTGAPA